MKPVGPEQPGPGSRLPAVAAEGPSSPWRCEDCHVRIHLAVLGLCAALFVACGGSSETGPDAASTPVPSEAPQDDEAPDKAPGEGAQPAPAPGVQPKAASDVCERIGGAATAEAPEEYLADLARTARRKGVQFHRLINLLQRAFAAGDTEKAYGLIDRLAGICEDVTGRRNF